MTDVLAVADLNAWYGKSHVLRGVSLNAGEGEIIAVLGRNGSGRSTLLKAIIGEVAHSGQILYKGKSVGSTLTHRIVRQGISYVPESRDIFPGLTVAENLLLGDSRGRLDRRWSIEDFYRRFPVLHERRNAPGGVLSGGEQQILTICRSLLTEPDVILIDEPTEGLAPMMVRQVTDLIVEVARMGVTIILVEQKLAIALAISERVYVMGHGQIAFVGSPAELRGDTQVQRAWLEV